MLRPTPKGVKESSFAVLHILQSTISCVACVKKFPLSPGNILHYDSKELKLELVFLAAVLTAGGLSVQDYSMQVEVATRLVVPAAQHGHANLIYLLDTFEADLEEPDSARGGPPLMHAANNGHVAVIHALLEVISASSKETASQTP